MTTATAAISASDAGASVLLLEKAPKGAEGGNSKFAGQDVMGPTTYEPENYAFGFFKGNEALVAAVNGALQELIADGTIQSILDKYMSE